MGRVKLVSSDKLLKRVRQLAYLGSHPLSHRSCAAVIRDSGLTDDRLVAFKYLGDHLALSLDAAQRREALKDHYLALPQLLDFGAVAQLREGIAIWRRDAEGGPPLSVVLESSTLAPMEGELQLRFSFRSELCVLTFLIVEMETLGAGRGRALFIGGVQGRPGAREEMRQASLANNEIAPTTVLMLAVRAFAKAAGIHVIIGIAEENHVSMSYSPAQIVFNYSAYWSEAGGERIGPFYRIPIDAPHKPLCEIPLSHRRRTKLKREAKQRVHDSMEQRLRTIIRPRFEPLAIAAE